MCVCVCVCVCVCARVQTRVFMGVCVLDDKLCQVVFFLFISTCFRDLVIRLYLKVQEIFKVSHLL